MKGIPLRPAIAAVALGLLLASVLAGCTAPDGGAGAPDDPRLSRFAGRTAAPEFAVTDIDGETVRLADLGGRVVLLLFMGLGCEGCERNLPAHLEFHAAYADEPRFAFVALNAWHAWCGDAGCGAVGESEADMRAWREANGAGWIVAPAPAETVASYEVMGTPRHFFIDHEGWMASTGAVLPAGLLAAELEHLLSRASG